MLSSWWVYSAYSDLLSLATFHDIVIETTDRQDGVRDSGYVSECRSFLSPSLSLSALRCCSFCLRNYILDEYLVLILKVYKYTVYIYFPPPILAVLLVQACPYVFRRLLSKTNIPQRTRRPFLMSSVTHSQLTICNSHFGFEGSRALTREKFPFEGKILWNRPMIISILMA